MLISSIESVKILRSLALEKKTGLCVFVANEWGFGTDFKFPLGAYVISDWEKIPDAEEFDQYNGRGGRDG